MAIFSALLSCFIPSSSPQVSDDAGNAGVAKAPSPKDSRKSKSPKSSSSRAPIVVSHFPHNSYISRL
ncbi:hypothetical protein RchiOBHm_Chr2g0123881 [Rosa chinensis]|uniref:Uncharacterized protein n=1 Tax=Rosa chinensis TaxID=74649 RepID=A0A2P6RT60_ROSCH|nr:hypothetical protein RchiOBHm_Chr2g0123881 [Rosa chinensis]